LSLQKNWAELHLDVICITGKAKKMNERLVQRLAKAVQRADAFFKSKKKPWESEEAKDKPNHAKDRKKWAAARAAATRKYGTKNSYVKNQYAARLYGNRGGKWKSKDS
jgi:ABC-type nitrate/sulfonate/bicarbonate transport system substrate-binding protein